MKNIFYRICAALSFALLILTGCSKLPDEQFEKKVYFTRNNFQEGNLRYSSVADMDTNISVAISGTSVLGENVDVSFVVDHDTLSTYNWANFLNDSTKYYAQLPDNCFTFSSMTASLKSGDEYCKVPVKFHGQAMDKYTDYVLPLRIEGSSKYSVAKPPSNILLLHLNLLNNFTGQYVLSGQLNGKALTGNSQLKVVDENTCYTFMGDITKKSPNYKKYYMTIQFNQADSTLTLSSPNGNVAGLKQLALDANSMRTNYFTENKISRTLKLSYSYTNLEAPYAVIFHGTMIVPLGTSN